MSNEFKVKNGIVTPSLKLLNFEQNKPLIVNQLGEVVTTNEDFWNDTDPRLYLAEDIQRCGFLNQTSTSLFFNNTANPVTNNGETVPAWSFQLGDLSGGEGWVYYINGTRCIIHGNKTVSLSVGGNPPTTNTFFIFIQNNELGTLSVSTSSWSLTDPYTIPVYIIKFNINLTPNYWPANERHTILIDRKLHYIIHVTDGTKLIVPSTLSGYTPNVSSDAATTFGISAATLSDEDIVFTNAALTDPNGSSADYVIFYRTNSSTWEWKFSIVPFSYATNSYIQYDNNGTLTTGVANKYYNTYLIYTNLIGNARFILVSGRGEFANLIEAQAEDPANFVWTGLDLAEYVIAYQFTWTTGSSYNNTGKVRLIAEPKVINISSTSATAISTSSHNDLSSLQGGSLNEYYHLTVSEYSYIQSLYLNTSNFQSNSISLNNLIYSGAVTVSTTTTDLTLLYSFNGLIYGSGKFVIQAISDSNIHATELLVIQSGVTATGVEYARVFNNNSLFNIEVDKTGDTIRVLTTSASSTLTKYTISFTLNKI